MTPNEALRALEAALEQVARDDFTPSIQVAIEIKDGKASAKLAASVMFKAGGSDYRYANESVEGTDWHETLNELARRRNRHVAVFAKQIAAPAKEDEEAL